ncbi:hypothetical protein B0J12DRAFT_660589 [Macrophomina phaseolina]|uniref:Uncharacterized protein n=1 Tax=Macrophomina phaseolina TaxID=35725 RepID=A0ABQ8GCM7_9PEZI|nr:hypothetical protein B0J12DRAFT_660589 [Macrophomina phaseolina]
MRLRIFLARGLRLQALEFHGVRRRLTSFMGAHHLGSLIAGPFSTTTIETGFQSDSDRRPKSFPLDILISFCFLCRVSWVAGGLGRALYPVRASLSRRINWLFPSGGCMLCSHPGCVRFPVPSFSLLISVARTASRACMRCLMSVFLFSFRLAVLTSSHLLALSYIIQPDAVHISGIRAYYTLIIAIPYLLFFTRS